MDKPKGKMVFFYQYDEHHPVLSLTLSPQSGLGDVLESFEAFLRAAGYVFDGQVDIVRVEVIPQDPNAGAN